MGYEWDDTKDTENLRKHGIGFGEMAEFDWEFAFGPEMQYVEGEEREFWIGPIGGHLFALTLTIRGEETRIISLRDASGHEKRKWRTEFQND